ncbi:hypothetical protein AF2641_04045 [Anoxybacillus flavithermus]|nr:hypothetical protein AF2641_04045 [Anoxybacillus flavithermus]
MKKWIIISLSIIVLLLGGAGGYYYFLTNKKVDLKKVDKKVAEIVEEEYEIVLPDDSNSSASGNEQTSTTKKQDDTNSQTNNNETKHEGKSDEKGTNNESESNKQNNTNEDNKANEPVEQVTVASIKDKYRPSFEYLQQQANAKIDALVDHAIGEYKERKANGQSVSFNYFFSKYNTAAQELEAKTDVAFNVIYNALENELKKNGFSPNHAKEFRETYEQQKSAQRNALLKKALSKL